MVKYIMVENHPNDSRVKIDYSGACQTLTGNMGTGGGNVPIVLETEGNEGKTIMEGVGYSLQAFGKYKESEKSSTLKRRDYKYVTDLIVDGSEHKSVNHRVRRLTPTECEALQGFPKGWTDIGEWKDANGKTRKCSDTSRYKALGNSIATPFWEWLLGRISKQYDRPATLGSLFDGISGFPYCWAKFNGKESCVWSSEIDEFCIAVAKTHFGED